MFAPTTLSVLHAPLALPPLAARTAKQVITSWEQATRLLAILAQISVVNVTLAPAARYVTLVQLVLEETPVGSALWDIQEKTATPAQQDITGLTARTVPLPIIERTMELVWPALLLVLSVLL